MRVVAPEFIEVVVRIVVAPARSQKHEREHHPHAITVSRAIVMRCMRPTDDVGLMSLGGAARAEPGAGRRCLRIMARESNSMGEWKSRAFAACSSPPTGLRAASGPGAS
jgi:hypothetical protein